MEYATKKSDPTKEIVFASDLIDDTEVDVYDFICPHDGCELELRLSSYKSTNLKAAYFGMQHKGIDHAPDCPILKQKKRITNTNGIDESIPFPFKSKLVLREYLGKHKGEPRGSSYKTGQHNNLANILATIVRWYIANPYGGRAPLDVPNCDYIDYQNVFHRITGEPSKNYSGWHIYYGQLLYNKERAFYKTKSHLVFKIYQAENAEPVEVKIDRDLLTFTGEKFIEKLYSDTEDKRVSGEKTWIFFLGSPVVSGSREFFFERYECVYFHSFEKLYLDSKYHFYVEPEPEPEPEPELTIPYPKGHMVNKESISPVPILNDSFEEHRQEPTLERDNSFNESMKSPVAPLQLSSEKYKNDDGLLELAVKERGFLERIYDYLFRW